MGIEVGQDEDCSLFVLMLERLLREDGDANLGHGWIMQQKKFRCTRRRISGADDDMNDMMMMMMILPCLREDSSRIPQIELDYILCTAKRSLTVIVTRCSKHGGDQSSCAGACYHIKIIHKSNIWPIQSLHHPEKGLVYYTLPPVNFFLLLFSKCFIFLTSVTSRLKHCKQLSSSTDVRFVLL